MKPLRGVGWLCALMLLGPSAGPAAAAWCNVFQVCCDSCGGQSASSYASAYSSGYASDPCCAPPQQVCTTRYVQRCYYQPVTSYQSRSYYEPVTTYRTSYYYEPVTSYRYSCYYDPCTCRYQQVACPTTSYQLRSQCCPVQSWVQRCCQVPVTSYKQCFYYEPVTSCCQQPAPSCCPTAYNAPAEGGQPPAEGGQPPAGYVPQTQQPPPAVTEQHSNPPAGVREYPSREGLDRQYPPTGTPGTTATPGVYRPAAPQQLPVLPPPATPAAPPRVRLDRIVTGPISQVQGQVVRQDNTPGAGARVMFISVARQGGQQTVTADPAGQFRVALASGEWLMYVNSSDGKPVFHSKLDVRDNETRQVRLVSR